MSFIPLANPLPVSPTVNGDVIDTTNSSTTLLLANGTFTGAWVNVLGYAQVSVLAFSDQISAIGGLKIEFSSDGTNIDHTHSYSSLALAGETYQVHVHAKFYRVLYTNGTIAQSIFRLQTILRTIASFGSILEADVEPTVLDDALLTKSIITGRDRLGNFVDVKTTTDGGMSISQNVLVDASNSSTINLATGASFTGAAVANTDFSAIQYMLFADQNCVVDVEQSLDGTNWDIVDTFEFYAVDTGIGNPVQLVGTYYRLVVTNVGDLTTTMFRLQTLQVPFLPTLPRSLDQHGNLKVSVYGVTDESGFASRNAPSGEILISPIFKLIGASFTESTLDTAFWTSSLGTGGAVAVINAILTLNTGTTANNTVSTATLRVARYTGGQSNKFTTHLRLSDSGTTANNTRQWGVFTATSGTFFQVSNGIFSLVTRLNSVDTLISNGSLNGNLGIKYIPTSNMTKYEILYNPSSIWFYINDVLAHTSMFPTTSWSSTHHLPITYQNTNTGGSVTNVALETRGGIVSKMGVPQVQPVFSHIAGAQTIVLKRGAGSLHGVVINSNTGSSITLYDNVTSTGSIIAVINPNSVVTLDYKGISFSIGLTVVTTGATIDCTVLYD